MEFKQHTQSACHDILKEHLKKIAAQYKNGLIESMSYGQLQVKANLEKEIDAAVLANRPGDLYGALVRYEDFFKDAEAKRF